MKKARPFDLFKRATLTKRLGYVLPDFQVERKAGMNYFAHKISESRGKQVLTFYKLPSEKNDADLSNQLKEIYAMSQKLAPVSECDSTELKVIITGYPNSRIGVEKCEALTDKLNLSSPLLYACERELRGTFPPDIDSVVLTDNTLILSDQNHIDEHFDHTEHPNVFDRCDAILGSLRCLNVAQRM